MDSFVKLLIAFNTIFYCNGVILREQLEKFARRFEEDPSHTSVILGAPSLPSHLPEAEPILPGHTLIRPARGMLKSAVKFPHSELDNGAGVYGNVNNLGIRYNGKQDRVMYTGFRRTPSKNYFVQPRIKVIESRKYHETYPPNKRNEMRPHVFPILLKNSDVMESLFRANKVPKLMKSLKHYNKGNLVGGDIMRRDLTPLGFLVMETLNEKSKEGTSYEDSSTSDEFDNIDDKPPEISSNEKIEKKKWFWNTKNAFNHIKISSDAPELSDLIPKISADKTRDWSYYNKENIQSDDNTT